MSFRRILTQRLLRDGRSAIKITRRQKRGRQFREVLVQGVELEMVHVPAGTFLMGAPEDELDCQEREGPRHEVTIAEPFFLGKYLVTQAQWRAVAEMPLVEQELELDPSSFKGEERPVEQVSWRDAVEFCARLSQHSGRAFRLPTEAEWEYACRANGKAPFSFGETLTSELANYDGYLSYGLGPNGKYRAETTNVGLFPANGFGFYDMHGNVWAWCQDLWHENYRGSPSDGSAWLMAEEEAKEKRVLRGGSWNFGPEICRSASRSMDAPDGRFNNTGFRVACGGTSNFTNLRSWFDNSFDASWRSLDR